MCQGRHLRDDLRRPDDAALMSPARWRLDSTNAELAAARERLVESMAQLERERARAADLRRRLAESYAERDRLRKLASVMDIIRFSGDNNLTSKIRGQHDLHGPLKAGCLCSGRRDGILDSSSNCIQCRSDHQKQYGKIM